MTMRTIMAVVTWLSLQPVGTGTPSVAYCQQVISNPSPSCTRCRVVLDLLAKLQPPPGSTELGASTVAAATADGRYYVVHSGRTDALSVFNRDGSFERVVTARSILENVLAIVADKRGVLHVFDASTRKYSVAGSSGAIETVMELPAAPFRVALLPGGGFVMNAIVRTWDRVGLPLHLVDSSRRVVRSFGAEEALLRPDVSYMSRRELTTARPDAVWAAYKTCYCIERWSISGEKEVAITAAPKWFTPWFQGLRFSLDLPPKPLVSAIHQDAAGRLWVLTAVAQDDWREGMANLQEGQDEAVVPQDWSSVYDTYVDVYDSARAQLLVRQRVPEYLSTFLDDRRVLGYGVDGSGARSLTVWELTTQGLE
jgi:hypothetical protein